ncbi:SDR family NAD(P)-dependent oxidoreductase [Nocardiopsis potens]|uniref:SDR family NAD(P)-dependent oxidoreductase n=1 Tax=Nocardiopsis potens TaxID=1246458 RepID=UPI000349FE13|nr:SDR family oxidoreductase [Nocardiopsis potens]
MPRSVLVTGGGTGIGRAIAHRFAEQGDDVVITGRRPEPLERAAALTGARALTCDHTDPEALARLAGALPERIDVLVNNAGGNTDLDGGAGEDLPSYAAAFRANLDANLLTAVLTTRALDGLLAPGGAVVHIGSIAAAQAAGSYGAAKAALAAWNLEAADALGPRDITANVVAPGYTTGTEFFRDRLAEDRRRWLVEATSLGRPGSPEDIAAAVEFLASPGARHITGQVLNVNGGAYKTR